MRDILNWYKFLEGQGLAAEDHGPGADPGVLSASVFWAPFYSAPYTALDVTGTIVPDIQGRYIFNSLSYALPTFTINSTWFIWHDLPTGIWYVSEAIGVPGARGWSYEDSNPVQNYDPYGTATGILTTTAPWPMPYDNMGCIFQPTISKITTPAAAGFPAAAGSIEMLVRPFWNNADGVRHCLWYTGGGAGGIFALLKHTDNLTYLYTNGSSRGSFSFPWTAYQLYHLVLNWGANTLYINDVLVKTFTPATLGVGASTLYIGDHASSSNQAFNGIIYYFISRNVALTAVEIHSFRSFFENLYIPHIS